MKAMKAMKAKRVSVIAKGKNARATVFRGFKAKTASGMTKDNLAKNKRGKIVSKKASARSKKNFANSALKAWCDATKAARKALNLKGFVPVGGKTAQGKEAADVRSCCPRWPASAKPASVVITRRGYLP